MESVSPKRVLLPVNHVIEIPIGGPEHLSYVLLPSLPWGLFVSHPGFQLVVVHHTVFIAVDGRYEKSETEATRPNHNISDL